MSQKPLSYDSLKTVLFYLNANLRFQVSIRCPSTRNTEKCVPLTINTLKFSDDYRVIVNHVEYKLGLHRKFHNGETPKHIQRKNEKGGVGYDVDKWGFPRESYGIEKTPGDVVIGEEIDIEINEDFNYETWKALKRRIVEIEKKLSKLKRNHVAITPNSYEELIEQQIEELKLESLAYTYRESNTLPPYDCFIQLSILDNSHRVQYIERVWASKKLHEAMKYLCTFMLARHRGNTNIKKLTVSCEQNYIIRLPAGVKLKVHRLQAFDSYPGVYDTLLPIIHESCIPFKGVYETNINLLNHPVVRNSKELILNHFGYDSGLLQLLLNLPNKKVYFMNQLPQGALLRFIKHWVEKGREVGKCFRFKFLSDQFIMNSLDFIASSFKRKYIIKSYNSYKGLLVVPMKNSFYLHMSYEKSGSVWSSVWILKLEVIPANSLKRKEHK